MDCETCGKRLVEEHGRSFCSFCGAPTAEEVVTTSPYLEMPDMEEDDDPTIQGAWWASPDQAKPQAAAALAASGGLQEVVPAEPAAAPAPTPRREGPPAEDWGAFQDSGLDTMERIDVEGVAFVTPPAIPLERSEDILRFWFGDGIDPYDVTEQLKQSWFSKNPDFDRQIELLFGPDVDRAGNGEYQHWNATPRGRLGHVIVLDQLTRNIYRDLPQAFAYDTRALRICLDGMNRGHDLALRPIERVFYYLPLQHAEDLEIQNRGVALMQRLSDEAPRDADFVRSGVMFSIKHRDIIRRFGRFPHRNAVLGRESTPEELEFLEEPGSSF